jgi:3-dehydroquinate synthase
MEDLLVHNFSIHSHKGPYGVTFDNKLTVEFVRSLGTHFIVDMNAIPALGSDFVHEKNDVLIEATETAKSYLGIEPVITQMLRNGLKRDSVLVAIGGGITQDIACFIANTFMRGIKWVFIPTTLLAQADSCIGSKSSINFGEYKNLLGSFTPPNHVYISNQFIDTLADCDFKSGVGEIIKLLLIDGKITGPGEITRENVSKHIFDCLQIKKRFIEEDEFDQGIRNILNYGHCFGHGIESATNFAIPHGIAITMGMDIANRFAYDNGYISRERYTEMHITLCENYKEYADYQYDHELVLKALTKDKKNTGSKINIVLPVGINDFSKIGFENESAFWDKARQALLVY